MKKSITAIALIIMLFALLTGCAESTVDMNGMWEMTYSDDAGMTLPTPVTLGYGTIELYHQFIYIDSDQIIAYEVVSIDGVFYLDGAGYASPITAQDESTFTIDNQDGTYLLVNKSMDGATLVWIDEYDERFEMSVTAFSHADVQAFPDTSTL